MSEESYLHGLQKTRVTGAVAQHLSLVFVFLKETNHGNFRRRHSLEVQLPRNLKLEGLALAQRTPVSSLANVGERPFVRGLRALQIIQPYAVF
jgi:hypothetical protein